ncbi:F510_1955 family glycosylhydrolase [Bacillus sp. V33-4]|uniref:F510_1955 family glycosylhydrolase n=1 Tax=Bacillus sp. V33-4 TaxID=2054169 RepID=UPI000C7658CD|nr:hypothetical protein [Bacillus sp. V33-4]PLR83651.1 hypothetical protein CVD23_13505 [Bacillus sp. V33-4]
MKIKILAGLIATGAILISGCSNESGNGDEKTLESGYKVEHIHGLAYTENNSIYVASHEGMIMTKNEGKDWVTAGNTDFDFMGFHVQSDGTMLTSGHPGAKSDLPNPLGVLESTNNGKKWETKALLGKVDFHILSSNYHNPEMIYGVNQMDSGDYKAGIYKSTDRGENWERLKATGLPDDLHGMYSLLSLPDDENVLIAGTNEGVFRSEDGGKTWKPADPSRLITAISVIPGSSELISYSITEAEAGIMKSKDSGQTWEKIGLDLGKDAVSYFGIHPKEPNKIAVVTFENNLLVSEDGGENWSTLMEKGELQN